MAKLATAKELADYLGVHVKTVLKWARAGAIPVIRLSKRCLRFDLQACERIVKGLTTVNA
jgi:excisionase family DNA binding protein